MTDPSSALNSARPGIDDASIRLLVRTFYARARADVLIGPIFNAAVQDWDEHIDKISDFWSSIMLRSGRYNGRPMRPHLMLPLRGEHFDRWLQLFEETARDRRIADSFDMLIATQRGEFHSPRHARD